MAAEKKRTTAAQPAEPLEALETLASRLGVPGWKLAGLMRMKRWAPGKYATKTQFVAALAAFEVRPMGGGRR